MPEGTFKHAPLSYLLPLVFFCLFFFKVEEPWMLSGLSRGYLFLSTILLFSLYPQNHHYCPPFSVVAELGVTFHMHDVMALPC